MQKIIYIVLIAGFLAVDWLTFHDFFKPGEVYSFKEYLVGFLSILVLIISVRSLAAPKEA